MTSNRPWVISHGICTVSDNPSLLAQAGGVDGLIDITGSVNHGAWVALEAIAAGKPVVLIKAEVDASLGHLLHAKAREAGVLLSCCDGDQPGVQLNLHPR